MSPSRVDWWLRGNGGIYIGVHEDGAKQAWHRLESGAELVKLAVKALELAALDGVHPRYIANVIEERLGKLDGLGETIANAVLAALDPDHDQGHHEHELAELEPESGTLDYVPRCSCGWYGRPYTRKANARKSHERHVEVTA